MRVHVGARSFGRAAPGATLAAAGTDVTGKGVGDEQKGDGTTLIPIERGALGLVTDVQRTLATSAIEGIALQDVQPLPALPADAAAGKKKVPPASKVSAERSSRPDAADRADALAELLGDATETAAAPAAEEAAAAAPQIPLTSSLLLIASSGTVSASLHPCIRTSVYAGPAWTLPSPADRFPTPSLAASSQNAAVQDIYKQMAALAGTASRGARERLLMQLPNSNVEVKAAEIDKCFHVAIDLPGFGLTEKDADHPWSITAPNPADILADIFRRFTPLFTPGFHTRLSHPGSQNLEIWAVVGAAALARVMRARVRLEGPLIPRVRPLAAS